MLDLLRGEKCVFWYPYHTKILSIFQRFRFAIFRCVSILRKYEMWKSKNIEPPFPYHRPMRRQRDRDQSEERWVYQISVSSLLWWYLFSKIYRRTKCSPFCLCDCSLSKYGYKNIRFFRRKQKRSKCAYSLTSTKSRHTESQWYRKSASLKQRYSASYRPDKYTSRIWSKNPWSTDPRSSDRLNSLRTFLSSAPYIRRGIILPSVSRIITKNSRMTPPRSRNRETCHCHGGKKQRSKMRDSLAIMTLVRTISIFYEAENLFCSIFYKTSDSRVIHEILLLRNRFCLYFRRSSIFREHWWIKLFYFPGEFSDFSIRKSGV